MKISDLFQVDYGINLELNKCEVTNDIDGINFVSRTSQNNGVVARVKLIDDKEPQPAGVMTCAGGGSVLSTFVQTKPFYSGRDLYILTPRREMSLEEKLFYAMCIKENAYRYNYGRQANKTLKDIDLPDEIPVWLKGININFSNLIPEKRQDIIDFNVTNWNEYKLLDLFNIERDTRLTKENRIYGKTPFVTAGYQNEGISDCIENDENKKYNNCLTIDMFANCFYRNYEFCCDDNILVLSPKFQWNTYIALFLVTVINIDRYKYSYGRQYRKKDFVEHKVKLPSIDNNKIDWIFMKEYIQSLPYGEKV